ncbi:pyridoxal phosphate-dependent transferase [Aspergillus similis]
MLSSRGKKKAKSFDIPWRFAVAPTYDKEANPDGIICFGMAEHGPVRADIAEYINSNVKFTTNSVCYPSLSTLNALPAAISSHLNKYFKPVTRITPEMVVKVNGCSAAGNMLSFALAEPGDAVLVSRPVYGRFELDYGVQGGVEVVYADTDVDEIFGTACVQRYEEALEKARERGIRARALVVVNPHNPVGMCTLNSTSYSGRCYPPETLVEIMKFCNRHMLHLISDEIYALCDFASGGLHLGFLISRNFELRRACSAMLRFHSPSSTAETIGTAILQDEDFVSRFIEKSRRDLAHSYRIATSILDQMGINYLKGGNAGFFLYIDLSPYLSLQTQEHEFALARRLLDNGLFLHPGEEHSKEPGWFRLVFSHDEHVLREGLRRLIKTVKET